MSKNNIHTIEGTVSSAQAAQIVAKKKENSLIKQKSIHFVLFFYFSSNKNLKI